MIRRTTKKSGKETRLCVYRKGHGVEIYQSNTFIFTTMCYYFGVWQSEWVKIVLMTWYIGSNTSVLGITILTMQHKGNSLTNGGVAACVVAPMTTFYGRCRMVLACPLTWTITGVGKVLVFKSAVYHLLLIAEYGTVLCIPYVSTLPPNTHHRNNVSLQSSLTREHGGIVPYQPPHLRLGYGVVS
jgi:hypothetical protein